MSIFDIFKLKTKKEILIETVKKTTEIGNTFGANSSHEAVKNGFEEYRKRDITYIIINKNDNGVIVTKAYLNEDGVLSYILEDYKSWESLSSFITTGYLVKDIEIPDFLKKSEILQNLKSH